MATHPSNLAWKISQTVEPSRLKSMRLQSQTQLSTHTQEISFHKLSVAQIDSENLGDSDVIFAI